MTLGGNMISKILEGSVVAIGDGNYTSEVNPAIENAVNVWEGSEQMLAESVAADINSEILLAYETFELASVLGAATVIAEGSGADGATMVMENAFIDFFKKIGQKIKEIGEWIVSIFRRIFKKTKEKSESKAASTAEAYLADKTTGTDGKKASEKIEELKKTAKSDPDPKKKEAAQNLLSKAIPVKYKDGQSIADKVIDNADKSASQYEGSIHNIQTFKNVDKLKTVADNKLDNATDYYKHYSKEHFGKELESLDRVKLELKRVWKVDKLSEKKGTEIDITNSSLINEYTKWYKSEFKAGSVCEKAINRIKKSCDTAAEAFKKLSESSNKPIDGITGAEASKLYAARSAFAKKSVVAYNSLSSYTSAVLSEHISIATAVYTMYVSFGNRLKGGDSVQEGLNFDTFLEGEDLGFDVTEESFDDDELEGCGEGMNYSGSGITSAFSDYIRSMV